MDDPKEKGPLLLYEGPDTSWPYAIIPLVAWTAATLYAIARHFAS